MQVLHRLSGVIPAVGDNAESPGEVFLSGDHSGGLQAARRKMGIAGIDGSGGFDMLLGYNQNMRRRLRIDVPESKDEIILVNLCRRDLSVDDLAEQAIGHSKNLLSFYKGMPQ